MARRYTAWAERRSGRAGWQPSFLTRAPAQAAAATVGATAAEEEGRWAEASRNQRVRVVAAGEACRSWGSKAPVAGR
eukprot:5907369-Pleurochrysis_carterae.AAC.1